MGAPAKDDSQVVVMRVVVMRVDADKYDDSKNFVLCVACTTNGHKSTVKAILDKFYSHTIFSFSIGVQLLQRLNVISSAASTVLYSLRHV